MVIGGNSAAPNFVPIEPHDSLPLCLRNAFKPIGGPHQNYYKAPVIALPGDLQMWKVLNLVVKLLISNIFFEEQLYQTPKQSKNLSDGKPLLCEARINNGGCYVFNITGDEWQQNGSALYPGFVITIKSF